MRISDWSSDVCSADLLRAGGQRRGDRHDRAHPVRVHQRPLEGLHAAHRSADHAVPPLDAEVVGHLDLGAHPVPHGDDREPAPPRLAVVWVVRSEEHTSELQSLMRTSYAVFCLKKKKTKSTAIPTK